MPALGVAPGVLPAFAMAMVLVEPTPGPNLAWLSPRWALALRLLLATGLLASTLWLLTISLSPDPAA